MAKKSDSDSKIWAFLAYLLGVIGFILIFTLKKKNKFAMFHAKQSLILFIFMALVSITGSIPIIGWLFIIPGYILSIILWVQGIVYALTGKKKALWLIGKFGEKMKFS